MSLRFKNKKTNTVKQCHIIQAMQPGKFPQAFGTLVAKLLRNHESGGSRIEKCRCNPRCNAARYALDANGRVTHMSVFPTREMVAKFSTRLFKACPEQAAQLFKIPTKPH